MIVFYSGAGDSANPEITLPDNTANIMLSFWDSRKSVYIRSERVHKARTGETVMTVPGKRKKKDLSSNEQ